jgi:hypothetical protein
MLAEVLAADGRPRRRVVFSETGGSCSHQRVANLVVSSEVFLYDQKGLGKTKKDRKAQNRVY